MSNEQFLFSIREFEIEFVLQVYGSSIVNKKILEIGSGNGDILELLKARGADIVGLELNGVINQSPDIISYDGITLPFNNDVFDIVFSSNVLEHVSHFNDMNHEIQRVLKKSGVAIHVMPTHWWRFYTVLVHYIVLPRRILFKILTIVEDKKSHANIRTPVIDSNKVNPFLRIIHLVTAFIVYPKHGVRGNRFTEIFHFHPKHLASLFEKSGWKNIVVKMVPIFYTDHTLFRSLSVKKRNFLSVLGKSVAIYKMNK